jgi:orotate phosphoribosyltransferase
MMTFGSKYGYGWAGQTSGALASMLMAGADAFTEIQKKHSVDAVAFTGSSGCAIGFTLAVTHKIPLIYVRKDNEKSHGNKIECSYCGELRNYVIVDDFIDSGSTVQLIAARVKAHAISREIEVPTCVGILCYDFGIQHKGRERMTLEAQDKAVKVFYAKNPHALA